jgi:hypothetical protein
MKHDFQKTRKHKINIINFRATFGIKISFHKNKLFCFGEAHDKDMLCAKPFGCGRGQFPISYLGIPIYYWRLTNVKWKHVEERLQTRLISLKKFHCSAEG